MILGSHNSWSYLRPKKWWLYPFRFMAKCQRYSIQAQYYAYNVRCFDLRVRYNNDGKLIIAHGFMEYDIDEEALKEHLSFLNKNDCVVRILHEARNKKQYTELSVNKFKALCAYLEKAFPNIKFYLGRNLYNWEVDYEFDYKPTEDEIHASTQKPRIIDDWWPWLYAWLTNKKTYEKGTDKDILLIDYVDIK